MRLSLQILTLALCGAMCAPFASAQSFSSGSTGSDGAYSPTVSGDFDPVACCVIRACCSFRSIPPFSASTARCFSPMRCATYAICGLQNYVASSG